MPNPTASTAVTGNLMEPSRMCKVPVYSFTGGMTGAAAMPRASVPSRAVLIEVLTCLVSPWLGHCGRAKIRATGVPPGREHDRDSRGASSVSAAPRCIHFNHRRSEITRVEIFLPAERQPSLIDLTSSSPGRYNHGLCRCTLHYPTSRPPFPLPLRTVRKRAPRPGQAIRLTQDVSL